MNRTEIDKIIEKYRDNSEREDKYGYDKCAYFERVAGQIEDNILTYEDDFFETEEDIIDDVKESFAEVDNFGNEDDY